MSPTPRKLYCPLSRTSKQPSSGARLQAAQHLVGPDNRLLLLGEGAPACTLAMPARSGSSAPGQAQPEIDALVTWVQPRR